MRRADFVSWIKAIPHGKTLPTARYIHRPDDWSVVPPELAATVERAMRAAEPHPDWNLLKLHLDQVAITFLTYPAFRDDLTPHRLSGDRFLSTARTGQQCPPQPATDATRPRSCFSPDEQRLRCPLP